ncbi:hypothetical protein Gohar_007102 [Gossypium harknessii]|uniref:WRKY domain-containing protein n=1 Tax=Gossypium harknessii TaxID=34285 RepID=A0A7J9GHL7_9ROSI|nr:hypothetical protein [Gossypium harknessii]
MESQELISTPPPEAPPPLTAPFFFAPSTTPSSSLHPLPPLESQIIPDIDWVSLLYGQALLLQGHDESKPVTETAASLMAENGGCHQIENGNQDKRKGNRFKKTTRPRFAFQTRSADDILDDGYRWRKYGQKAVKNSNYPRFELLPVHASHMQCEEAGSKAAERQQHRGDDLRRGPQSSLRKANGNPNSSSQANAIPL